MEQPKENIDSTDAPVTDTSMINVVWFKRDLRLEDHAPLKAAIEAGLPVLLIYVFEPSLQQSPDWNIRHWQFVYQSIEDLNFELVDYQSQLHFFHAEAPNAFEHILKTHKIHTVFSHQETGIQITYDRDKHLQQFFEQKDIEWQEFESNGVARGRKNLRGWNAQWQNFMEAPLATPALEQLRGVSYEINDFAFLFDYVTGQKIHLYPKSYQPAGMRSAHKHLKSFAQKKVNKYLAQTNQPAASQKSNSRLSPYLAWGNLSMRQVYQYCQPELSKSPENVENMEAFLDRLREHCHFIQKFEMECHLEFESASEEYKALRQPRKKDLLEAWKNGQTGFPIVDASMRCLQQTGYLNFRMRAVSVSFLTHHLWQSWKTGVHYLAQQFLDYEPGVHFMQFQAQAGAMGSNRVRIYNPAKESRKHDAEAVFIKKWVPELKNIPAGIVHDPGSITVIEQTFYKCTIGKDYPAPVVDIKVTTQHAKEELKSQLSTVNPDKSGLSLHSSNPPSTDKSFLANHHQTNTFFSPSIVSSPQQMLPL